MTGIKRGSVKWFDNHKKFGFLYVLNEDGQRTGEEVYFHYNSAGKTGVDYGGKDLTVYPFTANDTDKRVAFPRVHDQIVFLDGNDKTSTVRVWTFASSFEGLRDEFLNTPVKWRMVRKVYSREKVARYNSGDAFTRMMTAFPEPKTQEIVFVGANTPTRREILDGPPACFTLGADWFAATDASTFVMIDFEIFTLRGGIMGWLKLRSFEARELAQQ